MTSVTQGPLQQGTQQLLVVLHEPKEAAALARALKQDVRQDRTLAAGPAEFISKCFDQTFYLKFL